MPAPRSISKTVRPIYTRIKRISLYPRHAALKPFLTELDTMPYDIANEALLSAIGLGADQALEAARQKLERRRVGLPDAGTLQPTLLDVGELS